MPIQGLGQDWNVLVPCFGFSITGPGVDLAGANLEPFGHGHPRGRRPARRRDPGRAAPARRQLRRPRVGRRADAGGAADGRELPRVGWDFYGADGEPVLDPYGNPKAAKAPANAAAARKQKASVQAQARPRRASA